MATEENKAIARRWGEEVWGKGSQAAIDELLAANFVFNYPLPGATPDLKGYKQTVTMMLGPFADIQSTMEDMVAEGDKVAVRWSYRFKHTGEFMGIAPTGKQVTITGISILRIAGGKIVEEWGEMNNLGMLQQMGVIPAQG
jgi:predicted ester cyclase